MGWAYIVAYADSAAAAAAAAVTDDVLITNFVCIQVCGTNIFVTRSARPKNQTINKYTHNNIIIITV